MSHSVNRRLVWAAAVLVPTAAIGITAFSISKNNTKKITDNPASQISQEENSENEVSYEDEESSSVSSSSSDEEEASSSGSTKIDVESNGIELSVKSAAVTNSEDVKVVTYTIKPEAYKDSIFLSMSAPSDGSYACEDYIDAVLDKDACSITITLKKVFTKQIIIRVQSHANEDVSGSITLDYQDKVTSVSAEVAFEEGKTASYAISPVTTGGTLPANTEVTNVTLLDNFDYLKTKVLEFTGKTIASNQTFCVLSSIDADNYLKELLFNRDAFLTSFYYRIITGSSYAATQEQVSFKDQFTYHQFNLMFNGINPIFTLQYYVGGVKYTSDVSYNACLTKAPSLAINMGSSAIVF